MKKFTTSDEIRKICKEHTMYSWSAQGKINPIAIEKALGCYFWDFEGKKYFDLNSQLMCSNLGHNHPKVIAAIKKQLDELSYAGPAFATRVRAEASSLLAKHTPGDLKHFFYTLGGAEANENALKFAKFFTKRNKVITRYRSYHGATQGAITLTGDPRRWPNEPSIPGVIRTWDPFMYRSLFYEKGMTEEEFSQKMVDILEEQLMYENPESFAAMFIETVTGSNGIIPPPKGYLKKLKSLLEKYGILLICDEVMCGFGRTGEMFAVNHWNVVPDMITMAKGITSAYVPLGCVAVSSRIAKEFEERVFSGGLTYQSHPVSLAASVGAINALIEENVIDNSRKMGKIMRELMEELKNKHESVGDVRSIGLFGGIELVKNRKTKEALAPFGVSSDAMNKVMGYLKENGIFAYNFSGLLHTNPPLIVKENELRDAFKVIDKALDIADTYVQRI